MRIAMFLATLTLIAFQTGCGGSPGVKSTRAYDRQSEVIAVPAKVDQAFAPEAAEPVNAVHQDKDAPPPLEKVKRKIKYTAEMTLITEDFPKAEAALLDLIDANNGFLSNADVSTRPGQPRSGVWTARVPIEKVEEFRKGVAKIGELESSKVKTDDVTAQFYDLENHIKNKKAQEDALRELLKKQTDKMENLLSVQRELASVRDSIERSEGQLRLLANLTDLTTVTIHINERRKYVPEAPPNAAEKPAFGARVGKTFSESWQGFVEVAQGIALAIVALTPWLPVLAIVGGAIWYLVRRSRTPVVVLPVSSPTAPVSGEQP